jgi:HEAT repeat protein
MLRARDTPFKLRLIALAQRQRFLKIRHTTALDQSRQAADAIETLGPSAAPAVPQLMQLFDENPNYWSRQLAAQMFGQIGTAAAPAIPTLLRGLTDSNMFVRNNSASALAVIHAQPDLVVPELIKRLSDPEAVVRANSAKALGRYGPQAHAAVPALTELFHKEQTNSSSPSGPRVTVQYAVHYGPSSGSLPTRLYGNADVIGATKKALTEIDREAAREAGIK